MYKILHRGGIYLVTVMWAGHVCTCIQILRLCRFNPIAFFRFVHDVYMYMYTNLNKSSVEHIPRALYVDTVTL